MDRVLLKHFWNCGDCQIIDFAILRARLNRREKRALELIYDECLSQEEAAEDMCTSTRNFQNIYYSGSDKLLKIPWVKAYAEDLCLTKKTK